VLFTGLLALLPAALSLLGVGWKSSGVGLAASVLACSLCFPLAMLTPALLPGAIEESDWRARSEVFHWIRASAFVIALFASTACVFWPSKRIPFCVTALLASTLLAAALWTWWRP
jgi:hypothetical protein